MSKFREAESWNEFHTIFNEYIITLSETKDRNETYNMIVKDWAEYLAINKKYIHGGPRYVKTDIGKQMMYLLLQKHPILDYYLDIFYSRSNKNKIQDFSKLRAHVDNEIEFKKQVEEKNTPIDSVGDNEVLEEEIEDIPIDSIGNNEDKGKEKELEQVVAETLANGARMIENLIGMAGSDIKSIAMGITSFGRPCVVKVVGPKKVFFISSVIDILPAEESGVIETELDDYDVGVYAFNHSCWGDLEAIQDDLPNKPRIACNTGSSHGDIWMYPLFSDVWEFEKYTERDILSKLASFA